MKKSTVECVAALAASYPAFNLTEQATDMYVKMLDDLATDELQVAIRDLITTSKFFPTIAEIRARVTEHRIRKANVPLALEAWGEVVAAIGRTGAWGVPHWSTPLIGDAVRAIGGWKNLCLGEEGLVAHRARFVEVYDGMLARARHDDGMLPTVRRAVLPEGGGLKSIAQLTAPQPERERKKQAHWIFRAPTDAEQASGDYKTPEQLRSETIIRGVKVVEPTAPTARREGG